MSILSALPDTNKCLSEEKNFRNFFTDDCNKNFLSFFPKQGDTRLKGASFDSSSKLWDALFFIAKDAN